MQYWIGGSPCAGKSTLANIIAKKHSFAVYHIDDHDEDHLQRSTPEAQPTLHRLMQLRGDDLWLRSAEEQFQDEIAFSAEPFPFILQDVAKMPLEKSLIIEGVALLPHLVSPLLSSPHQAIWLVPTESFQRKYYAQRPWVADVLAQCSDPEQAWENWMQRDALFARWIASEAARLNLHVLEIDGSFNVEETAQLVEAWLKI